jgi:hypothetical protein
MAGIMAPDSRKFDDGPERRKPRATATRQKDSKELQKTHTRQELHFVAVHDCNCWPSGA